MARALDAVLRRTSGKPPAADRFNPYADAHPDLDLPGAAGIRRRNLEAYFAAYPAPPPFFLLAEAPGPWGCRFSGVPITSEAQLLDPGFPIHGARTSVGSEPHGEYSASIFWRVLEPDFPRFFVWNAYPFHPHRPGEPLSIRTPRTSEVGAFVPLVAELVELMAPRRVVAIGRKAEQALERAGVPCTYVRHPSQGGARLFEAGIRDAIDGNP